MKTNKEYPATHSMSTAWFAIDADGEVAIIDFDENGPVPEGIPEACIADLVENILDEKDDFHVDFTDEQWDEIMSKAKPVEEYPYDYFSTIWGLIVEIDMEKFEIIEAAYQNNPEDNTFVCLNEAKHLYNISFSYKWDDNSKKCAFFEEQAAKLNKRIFDEKAILRYIEIREETVQWDYEREDSYVDKKVGVFEALPFYLYQQSLTAIRPLDCTFVPTNPINKEQLSQAFIDKALKLPIRFSESKELQIAFYFPFSSYSTYAKIDGEEARDVLSVDGKGYFAFVDAQKAPLEIDDAFNHHTVEFGDYPQEYRINGKRGFFKWEVKGDKRNYYVRVGSLKGYFEDEVQSIEPIK